MKTANAALTALINGQRKALQFNGSGQQASLPQVALSTGPMSFECWYNLLATPSVSNAGIIAAGGGVGRVWFFADNTGRVGANTTWGVSDLYTTLVTPALKSWHHWALTCDRAGLQIGYHDGVAVDAGQSMVSAAGLNWDPTAWILSGTINSRANCMVDGVRRYSRVLTAVEVAEHVKGVYRNESNLVGYWPLDEGTGAPFDLSGNGNNGTLTSAPPYVDFDPYPDQRNSYWVAELLTITLVGGGILRFTTSDTNITSGGFSFLSTGPLIQRGKIRSTVGVEVDTLGLTITPKTTDTVNGQAWMPAVLNGVLDGADVKLERAYMPTWGNTAAGTLILFAGRVAEVRPSRSLMEIDVKSHMELLNIQMPRNLWQPGCVHTTFDSGCTLVKASFKSSTTATAGSTTTVLNCGLAQAAGYFDLGTVTITSGANNGVTRTIKSYTPGVITLLSALPNIPVIGDGIDAYPGDDKTQATCTNKFANLANFKATPYIPVAETAR